MLATIPSQAQSLLEVIAGLKFCRTLKDDGQRLRCFDGLLSEKQNGKVTPDVPDREFAWKIEDSKSPLDDSPQVTAILEATNDRNTGIVLRCKEKKTEVVFSKAFSYLGTTNRIKVLVRINNGKLIETRWSPSTNGTAAFAPSAIQFIRALPDHGELFIRAYGYSGNNQDGEFKLGKVSEVREKIAQACKWPIQ
jgi:hypothetical protein